MAKAKLFSTIVVVVLAIVLVLQNTGTVTAKLLFATVSMPLAFLILITIMLGFAAGVLVSLLMQKKGQKKEKSIS